MDFGRIVSVGPCYRLAEPRYLPQHQVTTASARELTMPISRQHIAFAAVVGAVVLVADSSALTQSPEQASANPSTSSSAGLILQESEGELRLRRPRGITASRARRRLSSRWTESTASPQASSWAWRTFLRARRSGFITIRTRRKFFSSIAGLALPGLARARQRLAQGRRSTSRGTLALACGTRAQSLSPWCLFFPNRTVWRARCAAGRCPRANSRYLYA